MIHADGLATAFHAAVNANQRLYNNRAWNVAALTSVAAPGTWVQDDNSIIAASPFVAPAAAPPDYRLNDTAGGGALCKGVVRRLPIVSPDTDITGYPRDRTAMADAGAWQSRDLVRLRLSGLSADDADFSTRLVTGMTSGATGLVRDWDDYRIIDTDGSGVETVRTGSDGGSVVVEVLSGTFQAETVRTLPDDYSDIPVGMWGGPFAPYRAEYRATAAAPDVVRTVRNKWSGTIQLADYLMTQSAYTAGAANEVIWIDDSEQYLNDLAIIARATRLMGAPWHLPEFYRPTGSLVFRSDTTSLAEFAYLRFVVDPADDGIVAGTAGHDIRVTDCEGFGRATHTQMIYTNATGDLVVTDSLLFAQDGVGIQAKSTNITIIDTTVDYATQALFVVGGRTAGDVLVDRCKFWETAHSNAGINYQGVDGDTCIIRNTAISVQAGSLTQWRGIVINNTGMTVAGGGSVLVEGVSLYNIAGGAADDGFYLIGHDEEVLTLRGCALRGGISGTAFKNVGGTADVTSEYNAWHNFATGFTGNWSDTGTINADPLFADVTAAPVPNLYPSSTSPLLGLVDNGQTSLYDIDGRQRYRRGSANDAGAYERFGTYTGDQRNVRLFLGYGVEPQPGQQWFEVGETIWSSGGTTGVVVAVYGDDLIVEKVTFNPWVAGHTVMASSGSTGTIVALGDVHTVSPRRDRDSATLTAAQTAAANGDMIMMRDGWAGLAPTMTKRLLHVPACDDHSNAGVLDAHPIAHARRMDPLRGRYIGLRGAAIFNGSDDEWYLNAAGSTDGWQGWVGLVVAGYRQGNSNLLRAVNTSRILLRDTFIAPQGLWSAGIDSAEFFSGAADVHVVGSWFRDMPGLTVPANVGLHVQLRLPDTAVTGTVVSRDNVHEDVTEHALYQDAAVPTAYDISIQRCLFRRYWSIAVTMVTATAARLNISLSKFHAAESVAPFTATAWTISPRGSARVELTSMQNYNGGGLSRVRGFWLNDTSVAAGVLLDYDSTGTTTTGGTGTQYDSIIWGAPAGNLVNVLDVDPLLTDNDPTAPDLHLQDGSPALGHVDPANLSLIACDAVDYHGFPVFGYYPNIHAGCLQHPIPGRVPNDWGGSTLRSNSGGLLVPQYTR